MATLVGAQAKARDGESVAARPVPWEGGREGGRARSHYAIVINCGHGKFATPADFHVTLCIPELSPLPLSIKLIGTIGFRKLCGTGADSDNKMFGTG